MFGRALALFVDIVETGRTVQLLRDVAVQRAAGVRRRHVHEQVGTQGPGEFEGVARTVHVRLEHLLPLAAPPLQRRREMPEDERGVDVLDRARLDGAQRLGELALYDRDAILLERVVSHRNLQRRADRNADRLAVERIAAGGIEKHGVCPKGRGVAEDRAHIVVIGYADQNHDQRACRQGFEQNLWRWKGAPNADRQYAAMHVEAGDPVHDAAETGWPERKANE